MKEEEENSAYSTGGKVSLRLQGCDFTKDG
jgi:hypothetical protein